MISATCSEERESRLDEGYSRMTYKKKLIEVALPPEVIHDQSAYEKLDRDRHQMPQETGMEINSPSVLQRIAAQYEDNPVVRALVQVPMSFVPYGIGSAIDAALTAAIENMREKRLRAFFDELARGAQRLTPELIQNEDFLHAYYATLRASINTRREEKIRLFARLLVSPAYLTDLSSETYEEFLQVLDDLSVRELQILLTLDEFERATPFQTSTSPTGTPITENEGQRADRFWTEFVSVIETRCGIQPEQLEGFLTRLARTGLYGTFAGKYLDYGGGQGTLTPLFREFAAWLQVREPEVISEYPE